MLNIVTLFLFLFIFSILSCLRFFFKFCVNLFQEQPETIKLEFRGLIFYGVCLSYIITYLIKS